MFLRVLCGFLSYGSLQIFFSLKYVFILSFKEINVWPMSLEDNKTNEVNILFKTL